MPCGKRPIVKNWDKPRNIRVITPSRYEQNEASVKQHWKKVIRDIELSYKDEQFWESQCETVRELVGPVFFQRIAKIFNLPIEASQYEPQSDITSLVPSEQFFKANASSLAQVQPTFSMSDYDLGQEEEEVQEEQSEFWSDSSQSAAEIRRASRKSLSKSKSFIGSKIISRSFTKMSFNKSMIKSASLSKQRLRTRSDLLQSLVSSDETAYTDDDLLVCKSRANKSRVRHSIVRRRFRNPHFDLLYCSQSETDMIKWKSKYKQKSLEVSASDEFSKRAEIMTKKISLEFYEWWVGLGNVEFKSEIKRPEDIEELFQVWFDEHASRGIVLDPKILPCVLQNIANYVGVPKASCPRVLKRQIAYDIHAETSPAHTTAFNTCLPQKMKHIPPRNNTEEMWHCVKIPEELRSMACVWEDIKHLTSTKAFHNWLQQRPYLPMPPCLVPDEAAEDKKLLFDVPSDYVVKDRSSASTQDLALPVSQFSIELKEVLSKLLNR